MDVEAIDDILHKHEHRRSNIIAILQDLQARENYLREEALRYISGRLELSLARIYEAATFYKAFSLVPRGKHKVKVCCGTACHLGGGALNIEQITRALDLDENGNTSDMLFTVETVNCLGICALAPVVAVDEDYYDAVTPGKVTRMLSKYGQGKEEEPVEED
jgi:NADH-quinone oxidoreductase subunit E